MRVLLYEWDSYFKYDILQIFKKKGVEVDLFTWKFVNKNEDEAFERWFKGKVSGSKYDVIFSVNYWPLLSVMAKENALPYIAWCYDNPLNVVNVEKTIGNPGNTVVVFDRVQAEEYRNRGFETVHYMPLGVNVERLSNLVIDQRLHAKYKADVSLVGSLYESRLQEVKAMLDEYSKGYIDSILASQQNLYGCYLIDQVITDAFMEQCNKEISKRLSINGSPLLKEALTFAMASEITRRERLVLLTMCGRRYDTKLYSFQSSEILQGVQCYPAIDYITEMPYVFKMSRINLNPILRCIQSGIPLRALDVMAVGGFLLSSYQPELAEMFLQEEEMVMYESIEDGIDKVTFYLQRDDLREKIARKGQEKVMKRFSMEDRLEKIFRMAGI